MDIKDFYLGTPLESYEYAKIPLKNIPDKIIDQYNLLSITCNKHVMIEIFKRVYGLPQAGILANKQLQTHLKKYGYQQTRTKGLYKHNTRDISFTLVVDDFSICYKSIEDLKHLQNTINEKYKTTSDETGSLYLGLTLDWDYTNRYVDIIMPGYINRALA